MKRSFLNFIFASFLAIGTLEAHEWSSYSSKQNSKAQVEKKKIVLVCVTFYNPDDCIWGWQKSTGGKLQAGRSVAVDPEIIPYFSKIELPGFEQAFVAEDTGSAVKSKKASKKRAEWMVGRSQISKEQYHIYASAPVVDVCVRNAKELEYYKRTYPEFVYAEVL